MILHARRLIFFHNPKAAGTSMENVIYGKRWDPYQFDPELFVGWHEQYGFSQHATYAHMLDFYDEPRIGHYYKFCFVRNPWDRVVSAFNYSIAAGEISGDNFGEFVDGYYELVTTNSYRPGHHATPQTDYIFHDGRQIVDFIGRYERLFEEWKFIADMFEFPPLPIHNRSKQRPAYQNYYNDRTKQRVSEMYAKDIEFFDYTF
jgi:hypothetical protein